MAMVNARAVTFDEIRLIICVNGYTIKNDFVIREIGFWSRNMNSVITFSSRLIYNDLTSIDKINNELFIECLSWNRDKETAN